MASGGVIPVREYGSAAEMRRHAAEVRARMFAPRPKPALLEQAADHTQKSSAAKAWSQPQIEEKGFVATEALAPQPVNQIRPHPIRHMTTIVAQITGVSFTELRSESRKYDIVRARHILFFICRAYLRFSYPEIARRIGNRDHSTAIYGVRRVKAVIHRLNIEIDDGPVSAAERLWSANWARKV